MHKILPLLALFVFASIARAEEDEIPAPGSSTPEAAAAARDKGYRAEEADKSPSVEEEDPEPAEHNTDTRSITPPAQRPLGTRGSSNSAQSSGRGGGGGASAAGVSCEKSVPPLTNVQRKEIDFVKTFSAPVTPWEVRPNEAISYKFKTGTAGTGAFTSEMGTNARPVATMQTLSETPCDFNIDKVKKYVNGGKNAELCYAWGPVSNGVVFHVSGGQSAPKGGGCMLKPNTVYYYNIRTLSNPAQGAVRDACQDEMPFFKSRPDLRVACGGIWKIFGSVPPK